MTRSSVLTAPLALDAKARVGSRVAPAFDPALDLAIAAPGHILVHGRGLDPELGGSLRLSGTLAKPTPVGAFRLRRGRLRVLTARLEFTRGNLTFAGDFRPELDFLATTEAGGATVGVAITGQASDPEFAFTSSPDLPEGEVLSRLLFGTPSGQLTTGQALALAQAAAQYSGGGDGAFERLRRWLGLGGFDVNLGASGGPNVGLERALNSRVNVGVKPVHRPPRRGLRRRSPHRQGEGARRGRGERCRLGRRRRRARTVAKRSTRSHAPQLTSGAGPTLAGHGAAATECTSSPRERAVRGCCAKAV